MRPDYFPFLDHVQELVFSDCLDLSADKFGISVRVVKSVYLLSKIYLAISTTSFSFLSEWH